MGGEGGRKHMGHLVLTDDIGLQEWDGMEVGRGWKGMRGGAWSRGRRGSMSSMNRHESGRDGDEKGQRVESGHGSR